MAYWAVARLAPHQERLALNHLERAGFMTYLPRLREWRRSHGRRIETRPLFAGAPARTELKPKRSARSASYRNTTPPAERSINTEHISCSGQLRLTKRFKGSMPQRCSSVLISTRATVTP